MELRRYESEEFNKAPTIYVCAYEVENYIWVSNVNDRSTYHAPINKLKLLGYFVRMSSSGYGENQQIHYVFLNPYNNKETDVMIDFICKKKRYNCFFGEYPLECIIAQQIPITSLLACQKNIPFDLMNIIQQFRIGEGNPKLQKLLEYCVRISEKNFMMKKLMLNNPKLLEDEHSMSNKSLLIVKDQKPPKLNPFEYIDDIDKYQDPKAKTKAKKARTIQSNYDVVNYLASNHRNIIFYKKNYSTMIVKKYN